MQVIPILVEAVKEQQEMIEKLEEKLKDKDKKSAVEIISSSNTLHQNQPNPFSESTQILYSLEDHVNNAMLNIYDMNGTQLKSITLHQRGEASVEIDGRELKAGMYMYSLIADGELVDTRTMVLTN